MIGMLQCAVEYNEMSASKKEEFWQVYLVYEAIINAYNQFIAVSKLSPEDIITMNNCVVAGTKT